MIDKKLNGKDIIAVPLADEGEMRIGYIMHRKGMTSRIGTLRELKFASEKYFKKEIEADELFRIAKELRKTHWLAQKSESVDYINETRYLKTKVNAGAEVLLSQLFFENEQFFRFVDDYRNAEINVPVIPGMSYALSQIIDLLVSDIDGIHLYTMNNPMAARKICEGIRHII